uniref:Uncharacterized protein n=1 Tax=Brassica oleracea var. oleracea TaxID=109376 RepID=A0A0D3CKP9_BRAOL
MRSPHGGRIIHLMGKRRSENSRKHLRRSKQIIIEPRRIFWRSQGSYRKLIRMRKIYGNRRVVICGTLQGI